MQPKVIKTEIVIPVISRGNNPSGHIGACYRVSASLNSKKRSRITATGTICAEAKASATPTTDDLGDVEGERSSGQAGSQRRGHRLPAKVTVSCGLDLLEPAWRSMLTIVVKYPSRKPPVMCPRRSIRA